MLFRSKERRTDRRQPAGGEPWLKTFVYVLILGTGETLSGCSWPRGSNYEVEGWQCSASCNHSIISEVGPPGISATVRRDHHRRGDGISDAAIKRFMVLEEVKHSDVPMAPLHYPLVAAASGEPQHAPAPELSMDGQICATQAVLMAGRENSPQN